MAKPRKQRWMPIVLIVLLLSGIFGNMGNQPLSASPADLQAFVNEDGGTQPADSEEKPNPDETETDPDTDTDTAPVYASACPNETAAYLINTNGMCVAVSGIDRAVTNKASIYTWKSAPSVNLNNAFAVALFVENDILVKYIDYNGREYTIANPAGANLPDGSNFAKKDLFIPENGYLFFVPNPSADEQNRDLRKLVLGTLTGTSENFVAGMLGKKVTTMNVTLEPRPQESTGVLVDEMISKGIHYVEKDVAFFQRKNQRERVNQLEVNLADENTNVLTSKALDKVVAKETVPKQAERQTIRGNRVVAGINADMFSVQTGINFGLQIQDGQLLVNHSSPASEDQAPAIYIDSQKVAHIDKVKMRGKLTIEGQAPITNVIDNLNRNENVNDRIVLYTRKLSKNGLINFDSAATYATTAAYAIVQVDNDASANLKAGQTVTGTVIQVLNNVNNAQIPADGVIISAFGNKAAWLRSNVAIGQTLSYQFDIYTGDAGTLNNDIVHAVSSYSWLIKNGKALTKSEMLAMGYADSLVSTVNARTAIGIKEDNSILAVTIDKNSTLFNDSDGVSLPDLALYMKSQGAIAAINLDGGGSTEMMVRRSGSASVSTVNHPSDGNSRDVTNAIFFTSEALPVADVGRVIVDKPITIYKGSSYKFGYRVTDANGNPFQANMKSGKFSTDIGVIDQSGNFTAPDTIGSGKVSVTVDGVVGEAVVQVVDAVDQLSFAQTGEIILQPNDVKSFPLKSLNAAGVPIILDPSLVTWSIDAALGTVDSKGQVVITAATGEGRLTATLGDKTVYAKLIVGLKEQIIDDFETFDITGYHLSGYMYGNSTLYGAPGSTNPSFSTEIKKSGARSMKIDYDTKDWARSLNGTINLVPHWYYSSGASLGKWTNKLADEMYATYKTDIRPKKFGMWVYGDGKAPWLRSIFKVNGQDKTIDLAPKVDWVGWKYLDVDIPEDWELPIVMNYVYAVETDKSIPAYKGTIYVDDLKFIYTDEQQDFSGPEFSGVSPSSDKIYTPSFNFTATVKDNQSGVDKNSLVVKVNGEAHAYTYNEQSGLLTIPFLNVAEGDYSVVVEVSDKAGNAANPNLTRNLHVDLSADLDPPVIRDFTPNERVLVQTPVPRITFNLKDEKTGVDPRSVKVSLDGAGLKVIYDAATGWGYAMPEAAIADGSHTIVIDAEDRNGNKVQKTQGFTLQAVKQPKDPNSFGISIIPDTQGNAFTAEMYKKVAKEDTELVLHVGDIVDLGTQEDYDDGLYYVKKYMTKPFFVVPGNHEAFRGSLDIFYELFGMPTFHFEFGNALIVGLNSAYGQSIDESDSTQYTYLQQLLDKNTKSNVLIYNHVITKDDFGTKHEMTPQEVKKFETILSTYKASHPSVDVQVVFGHLHALRQWVKDGVTYTISGNAANKAYVSHADGDILGTGIMKVTSKGMNYTYAPLVTNVYISNLAIQQNKMSIAQGASTKLNLYGDFSVNPSNYIHNLSHFPLVGIDWTSDAPDIIKVDKDGLMKAVGQGTANITASSGGKSHTVAITTIKQEDIKPVKLDLLVEGKMSVDSTQYPIITATDAYNNQFTLDGQLVKWTFKNSLISLDKLQRLKAGTTVGTEEITVEFNGLTATANIEVYRPAPSSANVILPEPNKPDLEVIADKNSVEAILVVNGRLNAAGEASAEVSDQMIDLALKAFNREKEKAATFVIKVAVNGEVKRASVHLTANGLAELTRNDVSGIRMESGAGTVSFDKVALTAISSETDGDAVISIDRKNAAAVQTSSADKQKLLSDVIGSRPVFDLSVTRGKKLVSSFNGGVATVSLPYTSAAAENPNALVVYHITDNGGMVQVQNGLYDPATSSVKFHVEHFSTYGIGYREISLKDIKYSFAKDDIIFLAARNILQGTPDQMFSPLARIKRADVAVILARMAGADLAGYAGSTRYKDIAAQAYYAQAVEWAASKGIVSGTGAQTFSPNQEITRAELAVMIERFASKIGHSLPVLTDAIKFADEQAIPNYAITASRAVQQAGIILGTKITGKDELYFAPQTTVTRQEAAAMLARLMRINA